MRPFYNEVVKVIYDSWKDLVTPITPEKHMGKERIKREYGNAGKVTLGKRSPEIISEEDFQSEEDQTTRETFSDPGPRRSTAPIPPFSPPVSYDYSSNSEDGSSYTLIYYDGELEATKILSYESKDAVLVALDELGLNAAEALPFASGNPANWNSGKYLVIKGRIVRPKTVTRLELD